MIQPLRTLSSTFIRKSGSLAFFCAGASLLYGQGLQTTYGPQGLVTLSYNGVMLVNTAANSSDAFDIGELRRKRPDGTMLNEWGGSNVTRSMDVARREMTWSYSWGNVKCRYIEQGDRLNMLLTVNNTHPQESVVGMSIYPLAVRFPSYPKGFDGFTPQIAFNSINPGVIAANYGSGQLVMTTEEGTKPLYAGWFTSAITAATKRYSLWVASTPISYQPTFWDKLQRTPIGPGQSDTYSVTLRFAPASASPFEVASDVYEAYGRAWPFQLNWPDRRPIGTIFLATSNTKWPTNPRGYLIDRNINVFTQAGREDFHRRLQRSADESVAVLKGMNAQGAIIWDIEGQEFPHMTTYIGDPRMLSQLAPEMEPFADEYFKKLRDAGLRVGVTIRPQQVIRDSQGTYQVEVADPAQQLINKISYAKQRWGATMFYVDVNGDTLSPMDALWFKRVADAHPDVLLLPEHQNLKYYAYTAPYDELDLGATGTPAEATAIWPNAFSVNYVSEGNMDANWDKLVASVRRGDILMFRGWLNDATNNNKVRAIYAEAGRTGGGPDPLDTQPPTVTLTTPSAGATLSGTVTMAANASDNVGVVGVQFYVDGGVVGAEDRTAPFETSWNTRSVADGRRTLTAVARDAAGNSTSTSWTVLTVSNNTVDGTAPSVSITSPANGASLSGSVTLSAAANDNVVVAGVQFQVDGVNVGAERTSLPYTATWDAGAATPGTHSITAIARDAAGNRATSPSVSVIVLGTMGGHWQFNEGSGTSAADQSGNGNTASLQGGATWADGRSGKVLQLNGSTAWARVPDAPSLRSSDFTISLWFRTAAAGRMQVLFSKPFGSRFDNSYALYLEGGQLRFHTINFTGMMGGGAIAEGVWQHAAAVKEGSTVRLYLNGMQVASQGGATATVAFDGSPLLLGAEDDNGDGRVSYLLEGGLDDARFYRIALSDAEIRALVGDAQPPTVALTSPAPNSQLSGSVTLSANASDNVGVVSVQFLLDGNPLGTPRTSPPFSLTVDARTLGTGNHTLAVAAQDAAGNRAVSPAMAVTVINVIATDTQAPAISITSPGNNATVTGAVQLRVTTADNVGVIGVQFYLDGARLGREETLSPFELEWDGVAAVGNHVLTAVARDAAGNTTTSAAVNITIPPASPITGGGLQAQWLFDEGRSTTVRDTSGNNNTGTVRGTPTWTGGRAGGQALRLSGGQAVRVADAPGLRNGNYTISLWFNAETSSGVRTLLSKPFGRSGDNSYVLYLENDQIRFHTCCNTGKLIGYGVQKNAWYHVAIVKDGNIARMYVNTVLVATMSGLLATPGYDAQDLLLGADARNNGDDDDDDDDGGEYTNYMRGALDDVRLYNRPLTVAEVRQLAQ